MTTTDPAHQETLHSPAHFLASPW